MARAESAQPYLSLDRYRQLLFIPICAFNGVADPSESLSACNHYWEQWEREMVARALSRAEGTLAQHLSFYLGPRFLTDQDAEWTSPMTLRWGHVIGGGIEGLDDQSADVSASDFTIDPATITIPQASFPGGTDEIYILETSSGLEIVPDGVATSGTDYVISIDQCKLIEWDDLENQGTEIDYDNTFPATTWLKLADLTIYRRYLDESDQATITFGPTCSCYIAGTACVGTEYTGCVYIINEEISKVRVALADYSAIDEAWTCNLTAAPCGCYHGDKVTVNYRAGTTDVPGWEDAVMALAHTYMLVEPCGCALFDMAMARDRNVPTILTAERINNPLGQSDGAWAAWQWLTNNKHGKAFMLG